jgi:ribonuclease P protein component
MLPKHMRLVHKREISQALRAKFKQTTSFCKITLSKIPDDTFKLLVIISKKVSKRAVQRNRMRRRIAAIFQSLKQKQRLPAYLACVIQVTHKDLLHQPQGELDLTITKEVSILFKRLITSLPK